MATVITNMLSAVPWIGTDFVEFVWGGFSVNNATLNRFFSLHYLLPFILAALALLHMMTLHVNGSSNPLGISSNVDRVPMHPYYMFKDLITIFLFFLALAIVVFYLPNSMGQLWPVTYYLILYVLKYAVCWNNLDLININYKNYYKTNFISYLYKLYIIFINNLNYMLNTELVKYCISGFNQQVTKVRYWLVGTSETLRVQKSKFSTIISNKLNQHKDIKFNQ